MPLKRCSCIRQAQTHVDYLLSLLLFVCVVYAIHHSTLENFYFPPQISTIFRRSIVASYNNLNQRVLLSESPLSASYTHYIEPVPMDDLQRAFANILCWFQHEVSHCTDVSSHINQILCVVSAC